MICDSNCPNYCFHDDTMDRIDTLTSKLKHATHDLERYKALLAKETSAKMRVEAELVSVKKGRVDAMLKIVRLEDDLSRLQAYKGKVIKDL